MAAELTIQSVEGLSKAFDKLSRSVGGVKSALGTMKGTNALQELQAVVAGVNRLEAALNKLEQGTGTALMKIVAKLDALPTAIADALGSGAAAVRKSGEELAKEAGKAAEKAADKAKSVQARADGQFRAALEAQNLKRLETQQAADAAFRAAQEKHLALVAAQESAAREAQLKADALFRATQEANAAKSAADAAKLREAQLKADAKFRSALADLQAKQAAADRAAAEKQMKVDADFRAAQEAHQNRLLRDSQAAHEKQLAVDATFRQAQLAAEKSAMAKIEEARNSKIKAAVGQATAQPVGSFSVFAPSTKQHGMLKEFNDELDRTPAKAGGVAKAMRGLRLDTDDAHSAMRGLASGFNLLWLTWGNLAPLLAGAALSNGFVQTVKMGLAVQQTFETIRVLSEETAQSVNALQMQMLGLGKNGSVSLKELSESMKTLSLAGLSAGEVGSSIRDVLNFAIAGDTSLKMSADTLTSVAKAFGYSADQYNIISDKISKAAAVSKSSVENMSEAFKVASVINSQYGASLDDVGVGLAALSNLGITGSAAGTALRNMYADLSGRSKEVTKILKQLKVEFRDVDTGKFPDLVTMMGRFEEAINKTGSALERQDLVNKLLSERGAKPVIELLQLMRTEAEKTGNTVSNQLVELRNKIAQSAGFSAIAAAELSTTASKQIDATFSSLQTAAYQAFASIEPSIFRVTAALRNAFESDAFRRAIESTLTLVASFIEGLAKLTSIIIENADAMKTLLLVYAGAKVIGMVGGSLANAGMSMAALATSAANAGGAMGLLKSQFEVTAKGATAAATGFAGAAAATSGLFAVIGRGLALLGPVAAALTLAYTAWELYTMWSNKAADANARHTGKQSDELIAALDRELQALKDKNTALAEGITLEEVQRRAKEGEVKTTAMDKIAKAETKLAEARAAYNQQLEVGKGMLNPALNSRWLADKAAEIKLSEQALEAAKKEKQATEDAINSRKKEILQISQWQSEFVNFQRARTGYDKTKEANGRLTGEYDPEAAARAAAEAANKTIQELEKAYNTEKSLVKETSEFKLRLLEDERAKKLITEAEYLSRQTRLVEQAEAQQLAVIAKYEKLQADATEAQRARLKAKYGGTPKFDTQLGNFEASTQNIRDSFAADRTKVQDTALERQAKNANSAKAAIKDLQTEFDNFWAKDAARLAQKNSVTDMADDFSESSKAATEFAKGAKEAMAAYLPEIEKVSAQIAQLDTGLSSVLVNAKASDTDQIALMTRQIMMLTDQLERLKAAAADAASNAGNTSIISRFLNAKDLDDSARGFDKAGKAMASFVSNLEKLINLQNEAATATQASQAKMLDALQSGDSDKIGKARLDFEKEKTAIQQKSFQNEIKGYANVAGAAKTFFKEGTTGYKVLSTAEKAFRAIEFAMAIKSVAMKVWEWATKTTVAATGEAAVTGTTAAGEATRNAIKIPGVFLAFMSQLGPWGVPAAAAAIAALGIAYGARKPSGTFEAPNEGTGTVLGDSTAKSKSVTNAIEKLASNSSIELTYSQGMLASLKNIEANIGGLTNLVLRGNVDGNSADRLGVGNSVNAPLARTLVGSLILGGPIGVAVSMLGKYVPIIGKLNNFLFGTKTTVKGTGLMMDPASLSSILAGSTGLKEYADVNTTKSFLGVKYSNKNSTVTGAADPQLAKQFQLIFEDFYKTIRLAATPLGQNLDEVTSKLNSFVVNIGKIDLQGLTGDQIKEKLTAVLGAAADNLASAALPGFEAFQKVGEGYFETVVRVANASEEAKYALEKLGLQMVSYTDIINKQGDVAAELVRASIMKAEVLRVDTISKIPDTPSRPKALAARYQDEFDSAVGYVEDFADAVTAVAQPVQVAVPVLTGVGKIIETFTGTAQELVELYTSLVAVRDGLRSIGKGTVDFGIEMIKAAGGVTQLSDGIQSFYDNFLTDGERIAAMTSKLSAQFAAAGVAMPTTTAGFKQLIQGLDLTNDANQVTFGKLIVLSDAFYKLQEALASTDSVVSQRKNLEEQLAAAQKAYNEATMTSAQLLALQRAGIDASNLALFDQIQALQAATEAAKKAASERADLQKQLDDLTLTEAQKLDAQRNALEEVNRALFDQVQAAKAAKAAEDDLANKRKAIADEVTNLKNQLDDLTLTDAQKIAKERAGLLSDEARGIFDQIQAAKAAIAAQEAATQAAEEAARAAEELRKAWQDAADGILEEINRIRGTSNNPQANLAKAQTDFTLGVARAQAGDVEAAKNLPKLSQDLLQIAGNATKSSLEFATIRASTLASLDRVLRMIGGGSTPTYSAPEMATSGVYAPNYTPAATNNTQAYADLVEEVRQLRELVKTMAQDQKAIGTSIAVSSAKTAKILDNSSPQGDSINVKVVT